MASLLDIRNHSPSEDPPQSPDSGPNRSSAEYLETLTKKAAEDAGIDRRASVIAVVILIMFFLAVFYFGRNVG